MSPEAVGTSSIEKGLKVLRDLIRGISEKRPDWNEAETRFQFIDPFITECLGWPRKDIRVEAPQGRTYTDYELGKPRVVIWEAKREGAYFELPANPTQKLIVSIKSVMALDKNAAAAMEQVQSYCSARGTPIAIVCNGHQLIVFIAGREDGQSPFDGNCLLVSGFEQLEKEFPILWQNLSPEGIKERRIIRLLTAGTEAWIPKKLASYLLHYPSFRYKSDIQANLRTVAELLIEDIVRTPEVESQFYKECYCESGALAQDAMISRQILRARYAALFNPTDQSPSLKSVKPQKDEMALTPEVMAEALARRPIVLIGDVGVGKTSFLKHLMYVTASEEFQRAAYIYIDLGSQAALESDLKAFVMSEVEAQLLKRHSVNVYEDSFVKGVYHGELELFKKGIYGSLSTSNPSEYGRKLLEFLENKIRNKPEHLRHSVQHIVAGRKQPIVLMIDNADQRNLDIQQEGFVIAQNFSQTWTAVVFIAVRPQTFHQSKQAGALSAYPQKIFSISPPRVDLVMEKRLNFALNLAEGRLPVEQLKGVKLHLHGLTLFLRALLYSLKTNMELVELLSNITGGNIREALDLITKFIGSPNVNAEKIISIMEKTRNYLVPVHEFSKSALLGEYSHYHPSSSIAMNLFDVRFPDEREHFLVPMVLAYLNYDGAHRNREGFTTTALVISEMQNWGFLPQQVEAALRRTTNKRLIETTERVTFNEDITGLIGDMPAAFRITTVGAYHLLRWAPSFEYLDAMLFDTPVFDSNLMGELTKDPNSFDIAERYRRTTLFRSYLNAVWHKAGLTAPYFDWMGLLPSGQSSFDSVANATTRQLPRAQPTK